jgi:hypothetical protein
LKTCVPVLTSYQALKSQFDWLTDGSISHLVEENLPRELKHLEMYLRLGCFKSCRKFVMDYLEVNEF